MVVVEAHVDDQSIAVIEQRGDAKRVVLRVPAPMGAVLLRAEGDVGAVAGRHTLQVGPRAHLGAASDGSAPAWTFLNHSCAPNAYFRERELVALRALEAGEELTFNYNATEYDLAQPFECHCAACPRGHVVRGYKHLLAAEREALGDRVMAYLKALA